MQIVSSLLKLFAVRTISEFLIALLLCILILGLAYWLLYLLYRLIFGERFANILDVIIPPLDEIAAMDYAYGCPLNGYQCTPTRIRKINLQGKGIYNNMYFSKYELTDKDDIIRYSGLYDGWTGVKAGSYVTFDNGQDWLIATTNIDELPSNCAAIKKQALESHL